MANEDRIGEVYRGERGTPAFQARSRDRIHWLVANARGRVLDVGCSQGITSLLLARAGHEVLGIDYEADRIEAARAELERRPAAVRDLAEFRVADASALDLGDSSFDSAVVGEVLEHLPDPAAVLREVTRVVKPDGVVVLTTPFGYSPHHDHHQTFFAASLVETLAPFLTIDSLEIVDSYFRVLARPEPMEAGAANALIVAVQSEQEQAIAEAQAGDHRLRTRYRRLAGRRRRKLDRARRARARERRLRMRLQRRLRGQRRSRWTRLGQALARARRPRGALALPGNVARALRRLPPPSPSPKRRRRPRARKPPAAPLRIVAEAGAGGAAELGAQIPEAAPLPDGPIARPGLRVATVLDRFSALAFRYEWDQVEVGPEDWRALLEPDPPELLFVESAWRGSGDRWARALVERRRDQADEFAALLSWCRDRGIPTVFWNKEDPPRFNAFLEAARLFDHVFTTDSDCFGPYREALGREDIEVLSFAAQPRIHNPISVSGGRVHPVGFAGTYIAHKHPERRRQMEALLDPARDFGLHVFARVAPGQAEKFEWPEKYRPHIVGSLPYERMITAYKAYRLFLNVNTVTASPSMCARRVFELSATATPVLSGRSRALEEMFGGEVAIADTPAEAREQLEALLGDPEETARTAHRAMRHVLREHTYGHRVEEILRVAGIEGHPPPAAPGVSALVVAPAPEPAAAALDQLGWQSRAADEVLQVEPGGLTAALERARGELLAIAAPGFNYGEHHLEDLLAARTYTNAELIGKPAAGEAAAHSHTLDLHPAALLTTRSLAREVGFDPSAADPAAAFIAACRDRGVAGYAADPFSFAESGVGARGHAAEVTP